MIKEKNILRCLSIIDGCDISDDLILYLKSDLNLSDHQVELLNRAKELELKWKENHNSTALPGNILHISKNI